MNKVQALFKRYFRGIAELLENQNTIEEKIFWSVVPLTVVIGIASFTLTTIENLGTLAIISGVACTVAPLVLAFLCYLDGNKCSEYYAAYCIALNCILMPLAFLTNGGLNSGMPVYCVCCFLLCSFCSNRHYRHIASSFSLYAYLIVFVISIIFPDIVIPIREGFIETDIILSFLLAAVSVLVVTSKAMSEYSSQRYRDVNAGLIDSLGTIIEFRSLETGDHVHNIRKFTAILLTCANKVLGTKYSKEEIDMISSASMLHDIGKVAVPDNILQKPGKLTEEEYAIMKRHPLDGCKMIESMKDYQNHQYFQYCYEICRHHHEHYDGSGYPDGLKGDEIPFISQVVGLADIYEALISKRVYKEAYPVEKAADIILNEDRHLFSEDLLKCFEEARPEFEALAYADEKRMKKLK